MRSNLFLGFLEPFATLYTRPTCLFGFQAFLAHPRAVLRFQQVF